MIADISIDHKSFGDKTLFTGLHLSFQKNEKIGIIGTNGCGKSTLLNMLAGEDTDYDGEIHIKKGMVLMSTKQEHTIDDEKLTVLEYKPRACQSLLSWLVTLLRYQRQWVAAPIRCSAILMRSSGSLNWGILK